MSDKAAPCPIWYESFGGKLNEKWDPIVEPGARLTKRRSLCGNGSFDCGKCELLQRKLEVAQSNGKTWGWWCPDCVSALKRNELFLPGFFHSGRADDPDRPQITGCTKCGKESSLLQLVIWDRG